MLIILSGSAGVGKNTIINRILSEFRNIALLTTVSTRAMREGESQGKPYLFVTREEFEKMISDNQMVEHCTIHGNLYGTNRKLLEEKLESGKILIKDIDVEGTLKLMEILPDVVPIYLKPKSKEQLIERLKGRGEKDIDLRLKRYEYEEKMSEYYKYVLINDSLEDTLTTIKKIISQEAHKRNIKIDAL